MSNKQINELLGALERDVHVAQNSEQILAALSQVRAYGKPLVYRHTKHLIAAALFFSVGITIFVSTHYHISILSFASGRNNSWMFFIAIACLAAGAVLVSMTFKNKHKLLNVAKQIYQKDALLDNNLSNKAPFNSKEMQIRFREFNRGNHSRTFKSVVGGEFFGDEHQFSYDYYHFHYVDKRRVTTQQGKRMQTKTVYDKFDRYGLLIPFGYCTNLQIYSFNIRQSYSHSLTTGSIAFDRAFKVKADDEFAATKFLKPAVVVAILDMSKFLSKLNIEIDATGLMCISFQDNNMIMGNQRYDLSDPEAFYNELAGQTKLRLLERTLRFVHQLLKHSDSNFKAN